MSQSNNPLDRPLGQSIDRHQAGQKRISWSSLALAMAGIALFVSSGAIALRERPFRNATPVSTQQPEPADTAAEAASAKSTGDGPQIIKVDPQAPRNNEVIVSDPSAVGQNLRVAHLPDRALIEDSETGPLPIRAADGRRPFDVYARPWSGTRGAHIALVIGGLGVSQTSTQEAIRKLPPEVTLAFASEGNSLGRWMQAARQKGHEIIMQVPLEPFDYPNVNPGRNTLTVGASSQENMAALRWALARITNYTGVMNYMGARFSSDMDAMAPVLKELSKRGLLYLDDGTSARSTAMELAVKARAPFAASDTTIDTMRDRSDILKKLDELERIARAKGFAIGTGTAFEVTVDAVTGWAQEATKRGIEIVPVSAVASDPERD